MRKEYPSQLLEKAIDEFAKLPGIGRRTATRLVLHLLRQDSEVVDKFGNALMTLRHDVKYCKECHNISDVERCEICSNPNRDRSTVCVVENIQDVIAIEGTNQYKGVYHVLGGVVSPMDGVYPGDLTIADLVERVANHDEIKEVIIALSPTMEGDSTTFLIHKRLRPYDVTVTVIARGISIGDELEYADEVTLGQSIINRTPFKN